MAEVVARGVRFHVQRVGQGRRTAVFIHGLFLDNLSGWFFTVANPVSRVAEMVLYDLRGHGLSQIPPTGYRIEDMVADLAAILEEIGLGEERVDVVGNSFGGVIALAFALAHPEMVEGLVLVDSNIMDERLSEYVLTAARATGEEKEELLERYAVRWAWDRNPRKRKRLTERGDKIFRETTIVDDLAEASPITDEELRQLRTPVLALYGEDSDLRDRAERLAEVLPRCDLRFFPGCTHFLLVEAPEKVGEALVEWLTRPEE